ncbi:MAG TPA: SCO family protein [Candidatus Kapabacteria bacterium]|nr:SCO family protein [Candidatus Kapabacteria bacterium]
MAFTKAQKFFGFIAVAFIAFGTFAYVLTKPLREYSAETPKQEALPVLSTVPDFSLIDQDGKSIQLADLNGKIWLADLIFTKCEGICPTMSGNFSRLQKSLASTDVRLVSFSVDPEYDSGAVLREYASRYNADPAKWTFVTGHRPTIFSLAQKGFLLGVDSAGLSPDALVTHSEKFVLIDKKGQMRGYYDGTDSTSEVRILEDIRRLQQE